MKTKTRENERRDSAIIIILILLFGFICIMITSGWALRFSPSWKLDTNMGSNLNPNSDFLTSRPVSFFEPLDPAILTNPAWINVFLTPGASFATRVPVLPTITATSIPPKTRTPVPPTLIPSATNTLIFVNPTNTKVNVTPLPSTVTPMPPATNTPIPSADLQITKTDGVVTYIPGNTLTYTITVRNNGVNAVNNAVVTDNIPAQITTWTWVCTSQNGGATGCNGVVGSSANFTDTVNLPNGASIVYTVTANIPSGATGSLTNIANVTVPVGYVDPTLGNNMASDVDTFVPPSADLQITKVDGVATYTPGGILTYTVTITNNGVNAVTGAVVTDNIPAQITTWDWACTSQTGGATGCNAVTGSNTNFTDTVNLPNGASIVYTVTANISAIATGNLINTASVSVPAGYTDPTPGNNSATDTDTQFIPPSADLQITNTDNATNYAAGISVQYTIVVSNPTGPNAIIGVTVSDTFSANLTGVTWTCAGAGGATCTANGTLSINDSAVNLPIGSSVTYTVNATVIATPGGDLVNIATVSVPVGITDPTPGNNSATDTDTLVVTDPVPPDIQIGTPPDGVTFALPEGSTLTLAINIVANGDAGYDLVYYERPAGSGVFLDMITIEIGDGNNWYTVFNWGDNVADTNTNVDFNILPNPQVPPEPDERDIPAASLWNLTGIAIDIDSIVPPGTYSYIRFYAPPDGNDNQTEIDAIEILP